MKVDRTCTEFHDREDHDCEEAYILTHAKMQKGAGEPSGVGEPYPIRVTTCFI